MASAAPSFPFENKVNTTERGAAEIKFEKGYKVYWMI